MRWIADATGAERFRPDAAAGTTLGSAEQSNTSIVIGDGAILKLFRNLKAGRASRRGGHALSHDARALRQHAAAAGVDGVRERRADDDRRDGAGISARFDRRLERTRSSGAATTFRAPAGRDVPNNFRRRREASWRDHSRDARGAGQRRRRSRLRARAGVGRRPRSLGGAHTTVDSRFAGAAASADHRRRSFPKERAGRSHGAGCGAASTTSAG